MPAPAPAPGTRLAHGLNSLREAIAVWEAATGKTIAFGLIGDASGDKSLAPGEEAKILAVSRVSQQDLRAAEEAEKGGAGTTFTFQYALAEITEEMAIVGFVRDGEPKFVVGEDEMGKFFTGLGRVGEVCFSDVLGREEEEAREKERREKKRAKRERQRARKRVEGDGGEDLGGEGKGE